MLTIYELIAPEEPPVDTKLWDRDNYAWKRDQDGWHLVVSTGVLMDWFHLIRDYGPLRSRVRGDDETPPRG